MEQDGKLIPVLQLEDLEALKAAREHLIKSGFKAEVGPFSDLPEKDYQDWMTPENAGYLFYLEKDKYMPAMTLLGEFFGYTEEPEDEE